MISAKLIIVATTFAFSTQVLAQESTSTRIEDVKVDVESATPNQLIMIDLIPTLVSTTTGDVGLGLIYQYRIGQKFSVGAFGEYSTLRNEDGILYYNEVDFERTKYGLEARGYLSEYGRGLYGSIGPVATKTTLSGKATPKNAAPFNSSSTMEQNGFIARIGYTTALGTSNKATALILDAGLEYGAGNQWKYSADTTGNFDLDEVSTGLGFNLGLGATF
jgi:hypothetical protein